MCLLLPLGAGQAAGHLLSRGVEFSGVTLAVTAPEGDNVPQLLEQYMGEMEAMFMNRLPRELFWDLMYGGYYY